MAIFCENFQESNAMDMTALDPELRRFVTEMREEWSKYPPFESLSIPEQRVVAEKARAKWVKGGPEMALTAEHVFSADGLSGELKLRIHYPVIQEEPLPVLVYLHGGGFTLFSIDTHDRLMREYAAQGGFAVIGVDYPLSPENKFPVALDLIEVLLLWLKEHAAEWQLDPARIAISGDSAGGNLSFATCLRLRDRGEIGMVKAILSNYGGFSPDISDEAEARFGGPGSIMDRAEAEQYWENYQRDARDEKDPYVWPLLADVSDFPPVMLIVPDQDIISSDSFGMNQKLIDAGGIVDCRVYAGAIHSFLEAMSISELARTAIRDGANFIKRHLS
jgi:acetyl esterase